jgi:Domain of unknown function (DUF4389)
MTTSSYPVRYHVDRPARFVRLHLVIRLLAFVVLGLLGLSLGILFWVAYIGLALFAAARLSGAREATAYMEQDGPRVLLGLTWFAAVFAWLGLVTDRLPDRSPQEVVRIDIERSGSPTASSALWRLLIGLPSALVLCLLGVIGWFVWVWAALSVLINERVGDFALAYLTGLQRWTVRLLAYQASLVETYPPFSFEDSPPQQLPAGPVV